MITNSRGWLINKKTTMKLEIDGKSIMNEQEISYNDGI